MLEPLVNSYIYHPDPYWIATPADLGLQAEDVHLLPEPDVHLHAWFFPHSQPLASLLFCHGNAGNINHRLDNAYHLHRSGFQVLLFDYRGYGHSNGQPSDFVFPFPLAQLPVKYDSLSKIRRITMPLLVIHGERDELIPFADGKALFEAAPEPKAWVPIPQAGHNDTYIVGGETHFQRLAAFATHLRTEK